MSEKGSRIIPGNGRNGSFVTSVMVMLTVDSPSVSAKLELTCGAKSWRVRKCKAPIPVSLEVGRVAGASGLLSHRAVCDEGSARQMQARAQAPLGRDFQADLAAMAEHDVAGDGEAEADAAGRPVARRLQAEERPEHGVALRRRNARSVIVDHDLDTAPLRQHGHPDMAAIAGSIADQVDDAAPQRIAAHGH